MHLTIYIYLTTHNSPTKINQNQVTRFNRHVLPEAHPLPKGKSLEVNRHTSDAQYAQCPVMTWKRHEATTLQRDSKEIPRANCTQCSCKTLKMHRSGLTCFRFSTELQHWPFETYIKHIIHAQNPFLSVTGWRFCQLHSLAGCHAEDGAPLATGDLASAGLWGISIFGSLRIRGRGS